MINTEDPDQDTSGHRVRVDEIVESGPNGAVVVAGIATFIVVSLWLMFYWLVLLPRGVSP